MAKKVKQQKTGYVSVQMSDLDGELATIDTFQKFIPEGTQVVSARFYWEPGYYDEPDRSYVSIEWSRADD